MGRTPRTRDLSLAIAAIIAIAAPSLAVACATHSTGFEGDDGAAGEQAQDDAGDGSSTLVIFPDSGGSTGLVLTSGDAAPQMVTFPCEPGTYTGMFTTTVTTDAGLFPSLLSFNWSGTLSITLVGHVMQTMSSNGENFAAAPVLTIAPGAMLSGTDNFGGHFVSGLSGQLDCPSKQLSGMLINGVYEEPSDSGTLTMVGSLTAVYQGTPAPPALTMGTIMVSSPMLTLGASGTWSATLQ